MKYLFMIIFLALTACGDNRNEDASILGEYWNGVGTINSQSITFLYVFEYPADQSIGVSYAAGSDVYLCRYFKVIDSTYVSAPEIENDAKTTINIYGDRFHAESEGTTNEICNTVQITTEFKKEL